MCLFYVISALDMLLIKPTYLLTYLLTSLLTQRRLRAMNTPKYIQAYIGIQAVVFV